MANTDRQLMEISRRLKDDPLGSQLLEEFLDACFDSVCPPEWALVTGQAPSAQNNSQQIAQAMARINKHLARKPEWPAKMMAPPAGYTLHRWAEHITLQVMTNGTF